MTVHPFEPVDGFTPTCIRSDNALPSKGVRYGRQAI